MTDTINKTKMPSMEEENFDLEGISSPLIKEMFQAGAHFGYKRSRRHPSTEKSIFSYRNDNAIINLEKTLKDLTMAEEFLRELGQSGKKLLLVGNKPEARFIIKKVAAALEMPYVAERWMGGTFTNFEEIRKRIKRLTEIRDQEASGEINKYKKKERQMIAKEKKDLERYFDGIVEMKKLPGAMLVIDSKFEETAIKEAKITKVPVVSLSGVDCDVAGIEYPIIANDSAKTSIEFFVNRLTAAYVAGQTKANQQAVEEAKGEEEKINEKIGVEKV
ncbi:MAG: 30S ribosomal protein S2 [Patescibacteria group bacterium]